jgi:hypothetical protein
MRRVTYVDESLMVGDVFGQLIVEYAAALAKNNTAEPLQFVGLNDEGEIAASFLLGPASQLVVLETHSLLSPPDNSEAEQYMQSRIRELAYPVPHPVSDEPEAGSHLE